MIVRTLRGTSLAFLLVASACLGAEPAPPAIRLPTSPVVPAPMPPGPPDAVLKLTPDLWYVIDSDVQLLVFASPKGIVKVVEEEGPGPFKIKGRFIDNPTKTETRTFKGKEVHTLEVLKSGRVEIIIVPIGSKSFTEDDVIRRTIDVDAGQGPQPPPIPEPKPNPPEPKQAVAWVVVVEETADRTPEVAKVLGDLTYWQGLRKREPAVEWRFYDKDSPEAKKRNYDTFGREVGLPAVLLLGADGKVVDKFKLPSSTGEIDAKLKGGAR